MSRGLAKPVTSCPAIFTEWQSPTPQHFGRRAPHSMQAECAHLSSSALRTSQRRAGSAVRVSRAKHAALRRVRPTSLYAGSMSLYAGSMSVRDGSVSLFADGERKPPPRPTQVRVRALCAQRTARGRVSFTLPRRVASASCLAASTRAHPILRIGVLCGSRFEGGTRTSAHVSAHPSFVLRDIRRALRGRHSSVSAQPCRGVRGAKNVLRARDRHPPPRSQRLRRRRFAPPTKFGSSLSPLSHSFAPSGMERGIRSDPVKK